MQTEKEHFLNRDSNTITISNFWENYLLEKYNFDPPYQRLSVWSDEKQSYFIDSIMKNFPVPPIFLRQMIDDTTGKTSYEVIDGKQRLTSITRFIENEIPVANEYPVEELDNEILSGIFFNELDTPELSIYKKKFWSYKLPIEYIDTASQATIDNIFDRLNRNGEPLRGQELRNAKYHNTPLIKIITELSNEEFWKERLLTTDKNRMEDNEFISELLFLVLERSPLGANQAIIDNLYELYHDKVIELENAKNSFLEITNLLDSLDLNYESYKITGVSHLYGLFSFAWYCHTNNINDLNHLKLKINEFYEFRNNQRNTDCHQEYKTSMSSRTKDASQRRKRMHALINYLQGN